MNKTLSILPVAILLGGCAAGGGNTFGSLDGGTGMGGSIVKMAFDRAGDECRKTGGVGKQDLRLRRPRSTRTDDRQRCDADAGSVHAQSGTCRPDRQNGFRLLQTPVPLTFFRRHEADAV